MMEPSCSKWTARPLTLQCGVCGAGAADVNHYGSVSCYSCRAFFRRSVGEKKNYDLCARGKDNCEIDQVSRTNCKKCRLKKCFEIGMKSDKVAQRKNKPRKPKAVKSKPGEEDGVSSPSTSEGSPASFTSTDSKEQDQDFVQTQSNVDICDIAENCVLEEMISNVNVEEIECLNDVSQLVFEVVPSATMLTLDDEFKICEMEAMKSTLFITFFETLREALPNFLKCTSLMLRSHSLGIQMPFMTTERLLKFFNRSREVVYFDLITGGKLSNILNNLEDFKHISDDVKFEIFQSSFGAIEMCIRAFMNANSDKEFFCEQRKAVGIPDHNYNTVIQNCLMLRDVIVPAVKGFGHKVLFPTPWAQSKEDEDFFNTTLETLGQIVKDDIKLGTIYTRLVLATPGEEVSDDVKNNSFLLMAQQQVQLLLFKYLKHKHSEDIFRAQSEYDSLVRLTHDLHICKNIHQFKRIHNAFDHPEIFYIEPVS